MMRTKLNKQRNNCAERWQSQLFGTLLTPPRVNSISSLANGRTLCPYLRSSQIIEIVDGKGGAVPVPSPPHTEIVSPSCLSPKMDSTHLLHIQYIRSHRKGMYRILLLTRDCVPDMVLVGR